MHLPMALHLAGFGHWEQGLNGAAFLAAALAGAFLGYIIVETSNQNLSVLRRFLRYRFWLRHKLFALAIAFRFSFVGCCFFRRRQIFPCGIGKIPLFALRRFPI